MGGVLPGDLTGAGVENDRQGVVVAFPRSRYPACQVGAGRAVHTAAADCSGARSFPRGGGMGGSGRRTWDVRHIIERGRFKRFRKRGNELLRH